MRTNLPIVLFLGVALIALGACGGGGGGNDEAQLRTDLEAAQAAQAEAEAARKKAEAEAAVAEVARKMAEEEAAEAERQRLAEEAAREEAEDEAEQERLAADEADQERLAAEAEQQRLAEAAEEARQAASRAEARAAFLGLGGSADGGGARIDPGSVTVTPRYGQTAIVTATATATDGSTVDFASKRRSSSGRWTITTLSNDDSTNKDDLVVYSDIDGPKPIPIQQVHTGKMFTEAADTSYLTFEVLSDDADDISPISSQFPTGGRTAEIEITVASNEGDPNDRTALISGRFDGASGHYQCAGTSASDCTIRDTGGGYILTGKWTFRVLKSAKVNVDDTSHMYFGWWTRELESTGAFSFEMFSNGMERVGEIAPLTGTATYTGPAVGQYAIYQPAGDDSGAGSFTARAELTANFGATGGAQGMLSGRVTNFSNASDWSITLNSQPIANGAVARVGNNVSWTISGNSEVGGGWMATFFSDVAGSTAIPEGVAGTFDAKFDDVGRLIGAFGAHCSTSDCPRN